MADIGAVLGGRYRLERVIGHGGMSTIFAATDAKLGRTVAVKLLRPEFGADAAFVERFRREAQSAASLSHPNIVAVYDYGTDAAGPYIVMEQVAGGDLARVLDERGALPPTAVARTGQQISDALAAAHALGLVHRDIKPGNILLAPDGRVQVADFGIAQAAAASPVTSSGIAIGSVLYFSPEQARGDPVTPASDIYALGLVLFEMLTGQRAFSGDSPAAVAIARLSGEVPSPSAVRPEVPAPLDAIVRWCLTLDPAGRPTATELSATLTRFFADPSGAAAYASTSTYPVAAAYGATTVTAANPGDPGSPTSMTVLMAQPPVPPPPAERSGSGPWGWIAAALGLLVIVASGILLFLLFSGIGEPSPSDSPSPSPSPTAQLVVTPDLVGLREARAERTATEAGFDLEIRFQEAGPDEVGRVIDQLPQAGTDVAAGTTLTVTIGTETQTIVVPDVRGLQVDDAEAQLEQNGLVPGQRFREDSSRPRGYVTRTEPRAGVTMTRGSTVDFYVSTGREPQTTRTPRPQRTPRPTRRPRPTAAPTAPTVTPTAAPTAAPPVTPAPLPTAAPDVSTPEPTPEPTLPPTPEPTPVPPPPTPAPTPSPSPTPSPLPSFELVIVGDYSCQALGDVRSQIEEGGLMVGSLIPEDPPPEDGWLVHGQLPAAGESVPVGSAVDLHLDDPVEPCPSA